MVHAIYIVKLVFFYALGGIVVATVTSGLPAFWHVSRVVEPADRLPEGHPVDGAAGDHRRRRIVGPAGRQDQADDRAASFLGAARHDPATAVAAGPVHRRQPANLVRRRGVPGADHRASCALVLPGVPSDSLSAVLPHNTSGLVNPALLIAPIVLLVVIGLRDKTMFLAARGEQYLPALFFFAVLPFVDMIIALKLLIVWSGWRRRLQVRPALHQCHPADGQQQPGASVQVAQAGPLPQLPPRPAPVACRHLHGPRPGTAVEILPRLPCCSRRGRGSRCVAAAIMVAFHLFIISTFPIAVPLEWNVLFAYGDGLPVPGASRTGTATAWPTCPRRG